MKNIYNLGLLALCTCALFACTKEVVSQKEEMSTEKQEETITRSITISQETKSTIDGEGNIAWESGDKIYYYSYYYEGGSLKPDPADMEKKNVVLSEGGESVELQLTIRKDATGLGLLMPGKDGRSSNNVQSYVPTAFGYTGINPDQDGSFAFANIAVAHSDNPQEVTSLTFKNITSIVKFNVTAAQNVTKVTMQPNSKVDGNQITGRITVDLTSETPSATYRSNYPGKKAARSYEAVIDYGEVAMNGTYYFAVMPTTLSDGFTLTFNDGTAQAIDGMTYTKQKYTAGTTSNVVFQANHIKNVGNPIENKRVTSFTIEQIKGDESWAHGSKHDSFTVDNFITFTATGDNGYYYSEDNGATHIWRCYQARSSGAFTISCPEGRKIASIKIKYNRKNGGALRYNDTTYDSEDTIIPATATNSISFTQVSTTESTIGQVSIKEVTVETK